VENNVKKNKKSIVLRLFKDILEFYPVMLPVAIVCILFNATISSIPAVFMQNVIAIVENNWRTGDWNAVGGRILSLVAVLVAFYTLSILSGIAYNQMMAIITQGTLKKFRCKMFARMQTLPIKYVDTHNHGDIMSVYTNDIDTLRQMISQRYHCISIMGIKKTTQLIFWQNPMIWMSLYVLSLPLVII